MRSKRIKHRFKQALATIHAAFAFADAVVEATRRGLCQGSDRATAGAAPEQASGEIFVILGRNLRRQLERMLAADDRYRSLRARLRRRRSRRDKIAKRGYALLVDTRKYLHGFFGYEGTCEVLGLRGPTEREPRALHRQLGEVVWWARNRDGKPEPLVAGGEDEAEKCLTRLEELHEELDQVIDEIGRGAREVEAAMLDQRAAMAEFDRAYKHGAGAMEAQLIQVGLPTLAAAVRPGVGRRGRPLKQRPVDLYPDLVEQVRNEGLVELDVTVAGDVRNGMAGLIAGSKEAADGSGLNVASPEVAGHGSEVDGSVSIGARKGSARDGITQQALPKRSAGEEIIEQPLHERSGGEEKSEHRFHERSGREEKSEHLLHQRSAGEEKSEQPLHESTAGEASVVFSRLKLSPPAAACGRDPRRRDLRRRPQVLATGRSPLKHEQRANPSWWQKLLRVA